MIVAHLDLDAFFAAVEELEDPSLKRVPLVVGGDPRGRGVVATANYVARRFGIHSAMSCAEALRRCPQAVFVRPRHALYRQYSQAVWSAVRDLGPSRAAVLVGMAPLVSVTIALLVLNEPLTAPLLLGALLIVFGGVALAGERVRPETFRGVGAAYALICMTFFAIRDNVVRSIATGTDVPPQLAASVTIIAGATVMALYLLARRGPQAVSDTRRALRPFALAGLVWGLSYASLFEAFYRGHVTVVSPLVATESLFGVLFAAVFVGRSELVGRHVVIGAVLIVTGGMLIGFFR